MNDVFLFLTERSQLVEFGDKGVIAFLLNSCEGAIAQLINTLKQL
ncbi:hypothetical protein [Calothrix rhizosoleniae]|nr:hypothetical protein [Calothrix rhizosoleniae]